MGAGMAVALAWAAWQGWGLGRGYPHNTILYSPTARFSDFTEMVSVVRRKNPYFASMYLPPGLVIYRAFSLLPAQVGLVTFLLAGLAGLYLPLVAALKRGLMAFAFLALCYPVLIALDRANMELYVAGLAAAALYYMGRARYGPACLCLFAAVAIKPYAGLLLLLLLRQRRAEWIVLGVLAVLVANFLSLGVLGLPVETSFAYYGRNLDGFRRIYILENHALEGSASLWNAYKLALLSAAHFGLMAPVDFSADNPFLVNSLRLYSAFTALLTAGVAFYVCLVEKEFLRCTMALLLCLSAASPLGADYRLLYAGIALVAGILLATRRPHDLVILVLLALVMVPKKEVILAYAGVTESGVADVSIQVLLNPLLTAAALAYLLYDGYRRGDARWTRLRWRRLVRSLTPTSLA